MTTVVIMPGGFHPFHAGHAALYNSIRRAFPGAEVFVAATNDTSTRPFPFAVKEKLAQLAGVEPGHFVQVKSPFRAEEITSQFDPNADTLIFVRSEKDATKPPQPGGVKKDGAPAYLQPLDGATKLEPFSRHAYMAYLPTVEFGPGMTSATEIRTAWPSLNEKRKTALVMSLYPKTQSNPKLAATVVKLLDTAMGGQELNEFAPSDNGDRPKFIPWPDFIEGVKGIVGNDFEVVENIVKSTIKARFVPIDPMEFGPTMLYSYYEARAGRNKGAVSTRGAIQVGRYYPNSTALGTRNFITGFNLLKGHPFERHFDLTPENISKIASIIMGNTEGAYKTQVAEGEGDPEGLPHLTPELASHIRDQIDTEGPQAIVKSVTWGDGAAEELTKLIQHTLDQYANQELDENQGWAATYTEDDMQIAGTPAVGGMHAGYQDRENQPVAERAKGKPRDAELIKAMQYIKQHYPSYANDPDMAMAKWIQRSLKHSEEQDLLQNKKIVDLSRKMDQLVKGSVAPVQEESDFIEEKWSDKYKRSIDCSNPKGFSQRAHCQGRKK